MLASVERRGYRETCQLHLFAIELTKANSNGLARRRRFRRKLDRLISVGSLKADRLRSPRVIKKGSNELACCTIAVKGAAMAGDAHRSTRVANAAGSTSASDQE